jgi:MoaA/NifB/PqqE/SkfB family radical SAM enzyme
MRQYFPILKERVRAREFNSLFLFVTSRCNSLCRTSFYFDKLNSPDDLTTAQIERISATAPPFRKLWLSGGEPFLRENLAEIVALFGRCREKLAGIMAMEQQSVGRQIDVADPFALDEQCLESPKKWPMPCTVGETSIVIDHNGRFRACEMRGIVGDLADFDFDVRRALKSEAMGVEVCAIPAANCWCTHSCFIQDSSKFQPSVQLFHIAWAWFRQRIDRLPELPAAELERFKALELA